MLLNVGGAIDDIGFIIPHETGSGSVAWLRRQTALFLSKQANAVLSATVQASMPDCGGRKQLQPSTLRPRRRQRASSCKPLLGG